MLSEIPSWPSKLKLAFAFLLVLLLVSETSALAFYSIRIGHGEEASHFLGQSDENEEGDLDGGFNIAYPKSLVELLEVAHPHSFGFVMFFFMLAALGAAIPVSPKKYRLWVSGLGTSILLFLAWPFVIRFLWEGGTGGFGLLGALISFHVYLFLGAGIWALSRKQNPQTRHSTG